MKLKHRRNRTVTQMVWSQLAYIERQTIEEVRSPCREMVAWQWDETRQMRRWIRDGGVIPSAEMLERAKRWTQKRDGMGWVLWSIQKNLLSGLQRLLDAGFDLHHRDQLGFNGLWHAKSPEMVHFLFGKGLTCEHHLMSDAEMEHIGDRRFFRYSYFLANAGHPLFAMGRLSELEAFFQYLPELNLDQWISKYTLDTLTTDPKGGRKIKSEGLESTFWTAFFFNLIRESREHSVSLVMTSFFDALHKSNISLRTLPLTNQGLTLEKAVATWLEGGRVCLFDSDVVPGGIHGPTTRFKDLRVSERFLLDLLTGLFQAGLTLQTPWPGECLGLLTWEEGLQRYLPSLEEEGRAYWSHLQKRRLHQVVPEQLRSDLILEKKSGRL